ncbi:MAG: type I-E CRISPR-associated endoribonuclease Cas2e [Bacteroidota bacterium]
MTVMILERAAPGERGLLTKWMTEISAGVFVGRLRKRVREKLWETVAEKATDDGASALMVWRANTPQGFEVRTSNPKGRFAEELDGVWLVRLP